MKFGANSDADNLAPRRRGACEDRPRVSGDFEIHLTGSSQEVDALAAFAARRGAKFSHIELDQGRMRSHPMLTVSASGTLAELSELAAKWRTDLVRAALQVIRVKIEAAPWNEGVPQSDLDAPGHLYFEHHVKLLLPSDESVVLALQSAVAAHGARVSRNARRKRDDGREERFVTQRCHGVGRATARARLDALVATLRDNSYEVLEVEEECVVHDDALHIDQGWLEDPSVEEAALRQAQQDRMQLDARRAAMAHVLAVVAASPWAKNLVLRGSVVLRAWLGDAAREPGDVDFVVTPSTFPAEGHEAKAMLTGLVSAIAADPGPGLRADQVASERIWD